MVPLSGQVLALLLPHHTLILQVALVPHQDHRHLKNDQRTVSIHVYSVRATKIYHSRFKILDLFIQHCVKYICEHKIIISTFKKKNNRFGGMKNADSYQRQMCLLYFECEVHMFISKSMKINRERRAEREGEGRDEIKS